ncbi:hypothetical protein D3C81_1901950 [compost metagenome]
MSDQSGKHNNNVILNRKPERIVSEYTGIVVQADKSHFADPVPVHHRVVERNADRYDRNSQIDDQRRKKSDKNRQFSLLKRMHRASSFQSSPLYAYEMEKRLRPVGTRRTPFLPITS